MSEEKKYTNQNPASYSESASSSTNQGKKILYGGAVLVIAVSALLVFAFTKERRKIERYSEAFEAGREYIREANIQAVEKLKQAEESAPTPEDKARAGFNLGLAQHVVANDPVQAVETYKKVITNKSYGGYYRAGSLIRMLKNYQTTFDRNFAKTYIFTGEEPWTSFIKDGDVEKAVRLAYEWSNELFPTATANYFISLWYGEQLLRDKLNKKTVLTPTESEQYRRLLNDHLDTADQLIDRAIGNTVIELWEKALLFAPRGRAHAVAYYVSGKEEEKKDAEESFKGALQFLNAIPENYAAQYKEGSTLVFIHNEYAMFLAYLTATGVENRDQEVKDFLTPVVERGTNSTFFSMLKNIAEFSEDDKGALRKRIRMMADVDPRINTLLKDAGWSI